MVTIEPTSFGPVQAWKIGSNAFGKPQMFVYSFLIDGLLIDTGPSRAQKAFVKTLATEHIDQLVVTHHHEDHSGNIEAIKRLKSIPALGSALCKQKMSQHITVDFGRWMTWGPFRTADITPFDSAHVQTPKYSFEIIPTPGHAIDQVSLYEPNEGWLFSGDIFVHDYIKMFMRDEIIGDQILSIRKLLKLDFNKMFCNHQPVMTNPKERLKNKLNFLEDFYAKVAEQYHKGLTVKQIMKALDYKDNRFMSLISWGEMSKSNMVRSVIKTVELGILGD